MRIFSTEISKITCVYRYIHFHQDKVPFLFVFAPDSMAHKLSSIICCNFSLANSNTEKLLGLVSSKEVGEKISAHVDDDPDSIPDLGTFLLCLLLDFKVNKILKFKACEILYKSFLKLQIYINSLSFHICPRVDGSNTFYHRVLQSRLCQQ